MPQAMLFHVVGQSASVPPGNTGLSAYLNRDRWDDWGKYCTQFYLTVVDEAGQQHGIGQVKIGQRGLLPHKVSENLPAGHRKPNVRQTFDYLGDEVWLAAEVVRTAPAAFRYFASPPAHWSAVDKARVATHLKELNLPGLFASNAGSRLAEVRWRLADLLKKGGKAAVRAHLREELASIEADNKNTWVAAMYRAAIADEWFCQGGFLPQ